MTQDTSPPIENSDVGEVPLKSIEDAKWGKVLDAMVRLVGASTIASEVLSEIGCSRSKYADLAWMGFSHLTVASQRLTEALREYAEANGVDVAGEPKGGDDGEHL